MSDKNTVFLPTFWEHNDDGTVTQRGGDRNGVRMTQPGGATVRRPPSSAETAFDIQFGVSRLR